MKDFVFKGTNITSTELVEWIKNKFPHYKFTEIRFFGSRCFGSPKEDSDIDVYILCEKKGPYGRPIFTELYKKDNKNYQIELHSFIDFNDGFVPTYLIGNNTHNQL